MTLRSKPSVTSLDILRTAFTSQHVPVLFTGMQTHEAALRFVAQLVRHTHDEVLIASSVKSCLPSDYAGNTLDELERMITDALRKGFGEKTLAGRQKRSLPKVSEQAVELLEQSRIELFHNRQREGFISIPQPAGGLRNFCISSTDASHLIRLQYFETYGKPIGENALKEVIDLFEARALFKGPCFETHLRTGGAEDAVYIDLGQENARVVQITPAGWSITTDCPIKFYRSPGLIALPDPIHGGNLKSLQETLGLDQSAWNLILAFTLGALSPVGPFMCLLLDGEQGSGKTLLCSLIKRLIDPNAVEKLRLPKSEHDLMIQASENKLLAFDNVSGVKWDISDALCSLSTGGGFSTRRYYTDNESRTFQNCRPFIINGIGEFASRPDLLERAIAISLPSMPEKARKTESQIFSTFEDILPGLLGCLYDAVACALTNLRSASPPKGVRMADAARWIVAAEPAVGVAPGTLARALVDAQQELMIDRVMSQPLAINLLRLLERGPFEGPMNELLEELRIYWDDRDRLRPTTPAHLSQQIARIRPVAARAGLFVEILPRTREGRSVRAWREGQEGDKPQPQRKPRPHY